MISSRFEELEERIGTSYDIVIVAAKRAQQIKDGARPLVEVASNNPLTIALHEIAQGKVMAKPSDESAEPEEPPQHRERHYLTQRGDLKQVIQRSSDEEDQETEQ